MKYLKTHESFRDFFKKKPTKITRETLEGIESTVQILNHEIYDKEILGRDSVEHISPNIKVGGTYILSNDPNDNTKKFEGDIEKYDFVVKDGMFWKLDFQKMMEYPGIKGLWKKSELLNYYYLRYNEYKHMADFDLTGEHEHGTTFEGGFYFLHLIDIHKMLGIEQTLEIYKELNS